MVRKKDRTSIYNDMTPMVDVVMLLITFFMLTTVFNTPQTMEINIPPDETKVEIAESTLLTLRVIADGTIFWGSGIEKPHIVKFNELRTLLVESLRNNPKMVTLIKVEQEGSFEQLVDVIDELNLAKITRFSTAPFTDIDKKMVKRAVRNL